MKEIELLAPAGNMEAAVAAVTHGATAIYLGGEKFSARHDADNFSLGSLEAVIDYCHLRDVKVYVAVNTLLKESEIPGVIEYIGTLENMGVDAFIVQDYGIGFFLVENFHTPIHASTQMTAHSKEDVKKLYELGFSRVILARELSLEEIGNIKAFVPGMELEVFIHGAYCTAYSGQCYMSGLIGGRSGNRGRCAQPCRLPYKLMKNKSYVVENEKYLLSPKDNMSIDHIESLYKLGVTSLKIEGRMKQPYYVAATVSSYRKKIDNFSDVLETEKEELLQIFNRSGFTSYLDAYSSASMMSVDSPKSRGVFIGTVLRQKGKKTEIALIKDVYKGDGLGIDIGLETVGTGISVEKKAGEILEVFIDATFQGGEKVYKTYDKALLDSWTKKAALSDKKRNITGKVSIKTGEKARLELIDPILELGVIVTGDIVEAAKKAPLDPEKIVEQIEKTGNTPFFVEKIEVDISENAFMPISQINALRRDATDALTAKIVNYYKKETIKPTITKDIFKAPSFKEKTFTVLCSELDQVRGLIDFEEDILVSRVYLETFMGEDTYLLARKLLRDSGYEVYGALPLINRFSSKLPEADGYLVRNIGDYARCLEAGKKVVVDASFHVANHLGLEMFSKNEMVEAVTISSEINIPDMESFVDEKTEATIYGHSIFMTTVNCPVGLYDGKKGKERFCKLRHHKDNYYLEDRMDVKLPVITNCDDCYAMIYNDRPVYMLHRKDALDDLALTYNRLHFTGENYEATKEILRAAIYGTEPRSTFTYGHFFQSVL